MTRPSRPQADPVAPSGSIDPPLPGTRCPPGPPTDRAALGRWGEDLAARYLSEAGLVLVERNWHCRHGEVDIVARDGDCLVICEVKTRRTRRFGEPVEAVRHDKVLRLRRLATAYLAERRPGLPLVRIDVIGVLVPLGGPPEIRHVRGVGS